MGKIEVKQGKVLVVRAANKETFEVLEAIGWSKNKMRKALKDWGGLPSSWNITEMWQPVELWSRTKKV